MLLPAGTYPLGEGPRERAVTLAATRLGRWPVVNAHVRDFVAATGWPVSSVLSAKLSDPRLADHPATDLTLDDAAGFCNWVSAETASPVRLPTGDEWEALARGLDRRAWPWGDVFDAERCACAEAGPGTTVPVTAHPRGASPFGAEQLAGNVWEWVVDATDGERVVRGGSYLDYAWGVRAARSLPADPRRATGNTGFRLAIDLRPTKGGA